jgi:CheY-like chemotaxis protein
VAHWNDWIQILMTIVDEAAGDQAALDHLDRLAVFGELPDVVLLDLQMHRLDGVTATEEMTSRLPASRSWS